MVDPGRDAELISIGEAARRLGVSIDTLRRWDESGRLRAIRKTPGGSRYYSEKDIDIFLHELFKTASEWAFSAEPIEIPPDFYCPDSSIFQARLIRMQNLLADVPSVIANNTLSLLVAITGEIGNNSFDHNIGNWPDRPGIYFGYDVNKGEIVLADRGRGVLATLRTVRESLNNHADSLRVAFTEIISGRAPEERGNGLKFVRRVILENPISLSFQSGDAMLQIPKISADPDHLDIRKAAQELRGCIALIRF